MTRDGQISARFLCFLLLRCVTAPFLCLCPAANEPTDHAIADDLMHVIWARGQQSGDYVHRPKSGLEAGSASVPNFYRPDEIKYHGHGSQRGVSSIAFLESSSSTQELSPHAYDFCGAEWRWPPTCDMEAADCEYAVRWELLEPSDEIRFTVQTASDDTWTGVAFSRTPSMPSSDVVLAYMVSSFRPVVMDGWMVGHLPPARDSQQNVRNITGKTQDGRQEISFCPAAAVV